MKPIILTLALIGAAWPVCARAGSVEVQLRGVQDRGGQMLVSLQKEGEFLQPRGTYGAISPVTAARAMTLSIKDVEPGEYSLSVLHDQNKDFQMQYGPDGRPAEGWAMHNGAALRGRPQWSEVKFTVGEGVTKLDEALIYPKP